MNLQESIALVYDPLKTAQGMLAFRAFRITQRYLDQIKYDPETQECPDPALEDIRRNKIMSKVEQIRVVSLVQKLWNHNMLQNLLKTTFLGYFRRNSSFAQDLPSCEYVDFRSRRT